MLSTLKQWFDRNTLFGLLGLLALHAVAWFVQHAVWSAVPMTLLAVALIVVTSRSLVWGVSLAMLEIMIGGHGHLIDVSISGFTVGLRLVVFAAVMLGTLYHLIVRKIRPTIVLERDLPFVLLLLAVVIGSVIGLARNSFGAAFDDANSYVTLGYLLPVTMIAWTNEAKRVLLWCFALGATWIGAFSLVLIYAFDHLAPEGIWVLYKFVRDARLFEVTLLSGPSVIVNTLGDAPWFFRVFGPAQASVMLFTILLSSMLCFVARTWKARWMIASVLALLFAIDFGGQSRSFWLGLLAGFGLLAIAVIVDRVKIREMVKIKSVGLITVIVALLVLWIAVVIPIPSRPDLRNSPYFHGDDDDTRELAVSSRWNLLGPMMERIEEAPILGSGFGTTVTFISDDPRVRAINENGEWTTYRFEWGYQDIWIKMGVLGLVAFAWILFTILRAALRSVREKHDDRWLAIGMACAVVSIFATHAFSPYLNHPIGIGFLIMSLPFFSWKTKQIPSVATVIDAMPKVSVPRVGNIQKPVSIRE